MAVHEVVVTMETRAEFVFRVQPGLTRSRGTSIHGQIWCEFGESAFPESQWWDFPIVVMSWWLEAIVALVEGGGQNVDVSFMDGPFRVLVFAKSRELWQAEWVEGHGAGTRVLRQFDFAPEPFIQSLMACSRDLFEECSVKDWKSTDVDAVISYRERLIRHVAKAGFMGATR